jgi:dipeptidyl aminopeptidase/acylaminoacyl peptidase
VRLAETALQLKIMEHSMGIQGIEEIICHSSCDGSPEPLLVYHPGGATPVPLVVGLHTWSYDRFNQVEGMLPLCRERGWALVLPEFRGPNLTSNLRARQAGGSALAIQDIIDAVAEVSQRHPVSADAVFLLGGSGGGHMSLLVAASAPKLWRGVSSWVPITDLPAWHGQNPEYAHHIAACCGGAPGASEDVDREYRERSPLTMVEALSKVNLSLHHGRFDPVVPYSHSWNLAQELERRSASRFFFDIFDGEHDIRYDAAFRWFDALLKQENHQGGRLTG